ncbi:MAG: metal-dependent transcriptional regulator [Bdellovibrionota bacterium]
MSKDIERNYKALESDISHSMTHYLLTIHKLKEGKGYARVTDIAKELDLTKGSVSTAIVNLKKRGLVIEEEDSKFLLLTEDGHQEVHRILSTRTLVYYFLKDFVGVSKEVANKDACMMEHLMSSESLEKLFHFMKDLACTCENKKKSHKVPNFVTALDLCHFDGPQQFIDQQKGDAHIHK